MAKKQEPRLRVRGDHRHEPDVRRLARAIVRLAVELDADQAQALADALEHEEALRRKALTRERHAQRGVTEADRHDSRKESA